MAINLLNQVKQSIIISQLCADAASSFWNNSTASMNRLNAIGKTRDEWLQTNSVIMFSSMSSWIRIWLHGPLGALQNMRCWKILQSEKQPLPQLSGWNLQCCWRRIAVHCLSSKHSHCCWRKHSMHTMRPPSIQHPVLRWSYITIYLSIGRSNVRSHFYWDGMSNTRIWSPI